MDSFRLIGNRFVFGMYSKAIIIDLCMRMSKTQCCLEYKTKVSIIRNRNIEHCPNQIHDFRLF